MTTYFRHAQATQVGTSEVTLATSPAGSTFTVIGFSLTNITSGVITANIRILDSVSGTSAYFVQSVIIPSNQSFRAISSGEKLIINPASTVYVSANIPNAMDVMMSYVEIV